jgi:hypothetical protein
VVQDGFFYDQNYTEISLKDDKVGFAIVTNNKIIKKRMSAEQCRTASDQNGNTNERTDDHSHELS